jgi:mannose-6-phosphate isomerase-like protein (cupin superfamily)
MTTVVPKVWGFSIPVLEKPGFQIHQIQFKTGGVCSEHMHEHRYNALYCLSGLLLVRVWDLGDEETTPSIVELRAGQMTIVPPGIFHQFEAMSDGIAIEVYWADGPNEGDIWRRSTGFKRDPKPEETVVVH